MHWRRAARGGGKWACTGAAAACVVGLLTSMFWYAEWLDPLDRWLVEIERGFIGGVWDSAPQSLPTGPTGFHVWWQPADLSDIYWWPEVSGTSTTWSIAIPLWIPFLLTSIPAAWLWRGDRRAARLAARGGCGGCGYDRAGLLATAPCPECGRIPATPSAL